jgi:hypothetical protein
LTILNSYYVHDNMYSEGSSINNKNLQIRKKQILFIIPYINII